MGQLFIFGTDRFTLDVIFGIVVSGADVDKGVEVDFFGFKVDSASPNVTLFCTPLEKKFFTFEMAIHTGRTYLIFYIDYCFDIDFKLLLELIYF